MILVLAIYVGVMKMMNKEIAQYINDLLADRERLLDEREDAIEETKAELANIYQAQKAMDYIIEENN
jgi:hypothetical protein